MGKKEMNVYEFMDYLLINNVTHKLTLASNDCVITLEDGSEWIFKG